jgi:demethylmenaquinone methyltransferase/2-methoxy-6-polyprenyl-1,4-benzoquinol methylase
MNQSFSIKENGSTEPVVLPIRRTKEDARIFYDRISRVYDCIGRIYERKFVELALETLSIQEGETVLEIGFGSGYCLERIAKYVGKTGKAYGLDISPGMVQVTGRRLEKARLMDRVELYCGDAASLPYKDSTFSAVFMSFMLELLDTPEISIVLNEVKRVLKTGGRLGVVGMSAGNGHSLMVRLYEWTHQKWPKYVDCRPIHVQQLFQDAGYEIKRKEKSVLYGLPIEIVLAMKVG